MKKITLLLSTLLLSILSFGQNSELYGTWYLTTMTVDLGPSTFVSDYSPPIIPTMTILPSLEFSGEAACNTYGGAFGYDAVEDVLSLDSFNRTQLSCDFSDHTNFENEFFTYFDGPLQVFYTPFSGELVLEFFPGYELIFQDTPLSVEDVLKPKFTIYPNPVSDKLLVSMTDGATLRNVSVVSITGQTMFSLTNPENEINVSGLTRGLYFLEITSEGWKTIQKFSKK